MPSIEVIPVGHLRRYVDGQERFEAERWAGQSVRVMLADLDIPSPVVGVVLANGRLVMKDYVLQGGDEIKLIPILGGG